MERNFNKEIIEKLVEKNCKENDEINFEHLIDDALEENVYDDLVYIFSAVEIPIPSDITTLPRGFHLNTVQAPVYLRNEHFAIWINKFNRLLECIGLSAWAHREVNVEVRFSNERKKNHYGSLTISELKAIIRGIWGTSREIEDILKEINNKEDYRKLLQELMRVLYRIRLDDDSRNPEAIYAYLDELLFEVDVLGEYVHDTREIVLYTKNIEDVSRKYENPVSREFERVFIHELFHAYHFANDKGELINRHDYTSKVVKESLASAFEWFYCEENKINGADRLKSSWDATSVVYYPYSGANNLLSATGGFPESYRLDRKKFYDVFEKSLKDLDIAMRVLLNSCDFYKIKNASQIPSKIIKRKGKSDLRNAFDELMKQDAIGIIAQREIPSIIKQSKNRHLIHDLLDIGYCYKTFNMTQYPVLATSPMVDPAGRERSYADPVLRLGKTNYYLCAQWDKKRHLEPLLDWIWENR